MAAQILKQKTGQVTLYSVVCGLFAQDSIFPPYPKRMDMEWTSDLNKVVEIFNGIKPKDFDRKEVVKAWLNGHFVYNKYIAKIQIPIWLYAQAKRWEKRGEVGAIDAVAFHEQANHNFPNPVDEYFIIKANGSFETISEEQAKKLTSAEAA